MGARNQQLTGARRPARTLAADNDRKGGVGEGRGRTSSRPVKYLNFSISAGHQRNYKPTHPPTHTRCGNRSSEVTLIPGGSG